MLFLRSVTHEEAGRFFAIHPHLRDMWARYASNLAIRLFLRWKIDGHIARWANRSHEDSCYSDILVIELLGQSIGFTGYFRDRTCPSDTVRMRWTGIARAHRGKAHSREVIPLLCNHIHERFPEVRWLSESCPTTEAALQRWFIQNGFETWDDVDNDGLGIPYVKTVSLRRKLL
jgi:RimJ/RimL family protein N-acetyltransferase